MVGNFGVVENAGIGADILFGENGCCVFAVVPLFLYGGEPGCDITIIPGQIARVGTRIGEQLMPFIQGLGDGQGVFGREAEPVVGLAPAAK
jgi:hypothetical protein